MQQADNKNIVDIDRAFQDKNPGLYRMIPRFILSYLKKVIHQDEINAFIRINGHLENIEFVRAVMNHFGANVVTTGSENIPSNGGCIFASNHPLGGLDALALVDEIGKKREDLKFIVNDILLQIKNLKRIFVGVNKHGRNSQEILQGLDDLYASGNAILIFPAGLVSRKQNGEIEDLEWKKSFVTKARQFKLPVLPVHIEGRNSAFFYNLARLRERLGIKANIEMLYLVDEMYRQKNRTINIIFGQPIPHTMWEQGYSDKSWAEQVKRHVYDLHEGKQSKAFEPKTD